MKCFDGNKKRIFLALAVLKWLVVGAGCCCKWFNSSAYAPTQPVYYQQTAPATYYTAPAAVAPAVAPTVVQTPACAPAPVVTQPCCPCQCQ